MLWCFVFRYLALCHFCSWAAFVIVLLCGRTSLGLAAPSRAWDRWCHFLGSSPWHPKWPHANGRNIQKQSFFCVFARGAGNRKSSFLMKNMLFLQYGCFLRTFFVTECDPKAHLCAFHSVISLVFFGLCLGYLDCLGLSFAPLGLLGFAWARLGSFGLPWAWLGTSWARLGSLGPFCCPPLAMGSFESLLGLSVA